MTSLCTLSLTVFFCCFYQIDTSCVYDDYTDILVNDVTKLKSIVESNRIYLDLSNRNLTDIKDISRMIKESGVGHTIIKLDISYNNIENLPSDIFQHLPQVRSLNISNNNLTSLHPDTFIHNYCLRTLDISYNNLENLPSGLLGSKDISLLGLTFFDVSHNKIKTMGYELFYEGLNSLRHVNISYNKLEYFEPWPYSTNQTISKPIDGYVFNFSHNNIRDFSNKMKYYVGHEQPFSVDLNFNNLSRLRMDSFKVLFKPSNDFTEYNLAHLNIDIRYNPWICDCEMYPFVRSFVDSFLRTHPLLAGINCASPPLLAGKSFTYLVDNPQVLVCNITYNCPDRCFCEDRPDDRLILIDCSHTNQLTMPLNLPRVSKCSPNSRVNLMMDLSHNKINNIIWTNYTQNIIYLNISNNVIDKIESKFLKHAHSNLSLDIGNNMFKSLPNAIQNIHYNNLYFDNNPLECNCDFLWFNDWIRLHAKHNNYTCTIKNDKHYIKDVTYNSLHCYTDLAILLCSILIPIFAIVVFAVLVYHKWIYETKVILSHILEIASKSHTNLDKSEKALYKYDVYISSNVESTDTRLWIRDNLLKKLDKYGLKVYYPPRNNPANDCRIDVMVENIATSRKILIILDESYLHGGWCIEEFDQAHQNMCEENKRKIIVFLCSNNINLDDIQQESLKTYIKHEQLIKRDDFLCWSKLRYEISNKCDEDKKVKVIHA
ncbi:hypothetical protein LOTGIDRAFT_167776 [Lottia gigantea]|uniref:TIR domain-containing protein n=1 Tax=Lottia gigantea TaxID=225164 RepID=V3ZXT7_LOTGI|nr:hypothetical protein LOTGIDRAFT_167776 [Lottia gigantea]ESO85801.1 hypothetical protein LOTGIDRAFT_167776 [Lottia gigantea]